MFDWGISRKISERKYEILFILLIFIFAFGVRGQLIKYDLFFEFDSYYHGRMAEYFLLHGTTPQVDPMAYYNLPEGGSAKPAVGEFFWILTATIFKLATLGAQYNKNNWIVAIKFFPAIFGALISVAMYFLGKELYGRKAGVAFAFFAATIPAFVYRTMAGFFEDDSLGFLPMVIALVFAVRAFKNPEFNKSTITNSVLAGLFMTLMGLTWQGFGFAWLIFPPFFVATVALMYLRREGKEKILNFIKNFGIFFAVMAVTATVILGPWWLNFGLYQVASYLPVTPDAFHKLSTGADVGQSVFAVSIGEESPGIKFWFNKYNALLIFPILAIIIFITATVSAILDYFSKTEYAGNLVLKRRSDHVSFLVFFWIVVSMTMAFLKLKYTYVFGLPLAASAGIVVAELMNWAGEKPGFEKKFVGISLAFMFLLSVAAGTFFVSQNFPNIEDNSGWKETLYWIKDNTPQDAKMFNWWNQGHWISFIAERRVSLDNRNYELSEEQQVAIFFLSDSEDKARAIITDFNSDYIIASADMLSSMPSLGLYAENTTNGGPIAAKYGTVGIADCSKQTDTLTKQTNYACGNAQVPENFYLSLPYKRSEEPNYQFDAKTRGYLYRNAEGTKLYSFQKKAANDAMIAKLFLDPESVSWLELVYKKNEVRVFKVKK